MFTALRGPLRASLAGLLLLAACSDEPTKAHTADAEPSLADAAPPAPDAELDATPEEPLADLGPLDADLEPVDGASPDAAPDAEPPPLPCEGVEGTIGPEGGRLTVPSGAIEGSQIELPAGALRAPTALRIECADWPLPGDWIGLGPALTIRAEQPTRLLKPARVWLRHNSAEAHEALRPNHVQLFWQSDRHPNPAQPPLLDADFSQMPEGLIAFNTPGLGDFALGYSPRVGTMVQQTLSHKAITGVSMGAGGATYVGLRNPERFDSVAALGGAVDWVYLMSYIGNRLMGGFCTAQDEGGPGQECPQPPRADEREHVSTYNAWHFDDDGGAFDRDEYVKIFQDLSFAFGNPLVYNPASPYLPPGVDADYLRAPDAQRCAAECIGENRQRACAEDKAQGRPCFCDAVCPNGECSPESLGIREGFFDAAYNPEGQFPVIPYCEGEAGAVPGAFDQERVHSRPVEILLAVDLNGNGRRDAHEPVIRQTGEPFDDFGCDGVPSHEEPGYDPETNPDPEGDDYDWYRNPTGTEGNGVYDGPRRCGDAGEPWYDFGLDGVPDTLDVSLGGYDYGEGNGQYDENPHYKHLLDHSTQRLWAQLDEAAQQRINLWIDGGIRDIFNFGLAGLHASGGVAAQGKRMRVYNDFPQLLQELPPVYVPQANTPDALGQRGEGVMVLYGTPEPAPGASRVDGAHIGTADQIINRFMTMLDWVLHRWPGGDKTRVAPGDRPLMQEVDFESPSTGRRVQYFVDLPPGYDNPDFAEMRYPVLLLLHGYGQTADDLPIAGVLLAGAIARGAWPKAIIIYPDGSCGRTQVRACTDGVDNDGDGALDVATPQRRACDPQGEPCAAKHSCRETAEDGHWCCPDHWEVCGPPDPQCNSIYARSEDGTSPPHCSDGVDNDRDGLTDLDDPGCMGDPNRDDESDCKRGSFYTAHVAGRAGEAGGPDWEAMILDILDDADARFRTLPTETVERPY